MLQLGLTKIKVFLCVFFFLQMFIETTFALSISIWSIQQDEQKDCIQIKNLCILDKFVKF